MLDLRQNCRSESGRDYNHCLYLAARASSDAESPYPTEESSNRDNWVRANLFCSIKGYSRATGWSAHLIDRDTANSLNAIHLDAAGSIAIKVYQYERIYDETYIRRRYFHYFTRRQDYRLNRDSYNQVFTRIDCSF